MSASAVFSYTGN